MATFPLPSSESEGDSEFTAMEVWLGCGETEVVQAEDAALMAPVVYSIPLLSRSKARYTLPLASASDGPKEPLAAS